MYDIVILGSGPAGLTAALYSARAHKKTLVLGGEKLGGQTAGIPKLENYPGWQGSGLELAEFMKKQCESFGTEVLMEEVSKIERKEETNLFVVTTKSGKSFESKAVIIATGASPRKLEIKGAKEFSGRGVSYCATCDGFFFTDKTVLVVGGGNSALNDALYLADLAKSVIVLNRKNSFSRAEPIVVARAKEHKNIEFMFETELSEVGGNDEGVTYAVTNTGQKIECDGVFVAIGHEANTDFLPEEYKRDKLGRLVTVPNGTKIADGLFAAGDVRSDCKMQIAVATGWGCEASMDSIAYINQRG